MSKLNYARSYGEEEPKKVGDRWITFFGPLAQELEVVEVKFPGLYVVKVVRMWDINDPKMIEE